jgi:hypothetical protein
MLIQISSMNPKPNNQDKILKHLGLSNEMTKLPTLDSFIRYVTEEYRNSTRKETDEAYGMFEINLLHKPSGIRLTLTSREDYSGDVIYKVIRLFMITTSKEELELINVDFECNSYFTQKGTIPFAEITKEI